jgi:hypothetical protein
VIQIKLFILPIFLKQRSEKADPNVGHFFLLMIDLSPVQHSKAASAGTSRDRLSTTSHEERRRDEEDEEKDILGPRLKGIKQIVN